MVLQKFNKKQLDVLKELGNICAGNATIALSQILFKKIELQVPKIQILALEEIPKFIGEEEKPIVGIQMETLGAIHGYALLIFSEKCAFNLMGLLIGKSNDQPKLITEIGISSLKEIGNIVISSYLSTLSSLSRLAVFPSCPQFYDGLPSSVIKNVFKGLNAKDSQVILIETVFTENITSVSGEFFIAFNSQSMQLILKACEKNLCVQK